MNNVRRNWTPQDELCYLRKCREAALSARAGPAEQQFRAERSPVLEPVDVVKRHRHVLPAGPVGEKIDGSDWPIVSSLVHTVVVVAARRQISRFLSFVDVEGACKAAKMPADKSSKKVALHVETMDNHDVRLQLVMGRQLRSQMQNDAATHQLIKSVRPGCVLGVSGYPQRNRGSPTDLDVLELICEEVVVLFESPTRLPGMWPAQSGVMHEVRCYPRQRAPRGRKARDKAIEAGRVYKERLVDSSLIFRSFFNKPCECAQNPIILLRWVVQADAY